MLIRRLGWALMGAFLWTSFAPAADAAVDFSLLAPMKARAIGPAGMSGRIAAVVADPQSPNTIYVGAATGGLWRSVDGGLTWDPLFDDQPMASIGAIAIDPSNSAVLWVGTGEGNLRNSVSIGNGIYRSRDGGRSWEHLGLEGSERIHRIFVHPTNPDRVWVAALGKMWGDNEERGVYRTDDGGRSWQRILYVNERTGCADLELDPNNPDKLFAAMYEYRRSPWFYQSGGPGSGLYRSVDGGDSWTRLEPEDGMPEGDLGRIGLAVAPSDSRHVYAYVEAKENLLLHSSDGGFSFSDTGARDRIGSRPFYYADLRVDSADPSRVYSLWSLVSVSDDYGKSFSNLMPWDAAHPDHHAMWIDPLDPNYIIEGNDGGVYISRDRGETWRFVNNLPLAQFYHIAVDMDLPYHVFGGMQDNGSWRGPSSVWENGGIRNHHWQEVSFGDGFDTQPMPDDSMRGYSMSQQGYLNRWNMRTGEVRSIRPAPIDDQPLRFNWNAGFAQNPFDADTIYYGSQYLHRSRDRGLSWETISGDLTTNNPEWQEQAKSGGLTLDVTGAENFTTIVAVEPSPLRSGLIWVGTDDGRVQLTRNGGQSWESVEDRAKGVPKNTWVPHICASPHDPSVAFVVFDNHRRSDTATYVYRTTDYGRKWTSISRPNIEGYALSIEQDPVDPDLLFLGTEFGLWLSLDGGENWAKWTHGVPTVGVRDLVIHPRDHDLVIGTHGRAAFILDDIRPLREIDEAVLAEPLYFFEVADAQQYEVRQTGASRFPGATEFRGENRPYGALLNFVVNGEGLPHPDEEVEKAEQIARRARDEDSGSEDADSATAEGTGDAAGPPTKAQIKILDASGEEVRSFEREVTRGLNRVVWNLRSDGFRNPPGSERDFFDDPQGPEVSPGEYTVVLEFGEESAKRPVRVLNDPRLKISAEDRRANYETRRRVGALQDLLADALTRIVDARDDVDLVIERIERVRREAKARGVEWEEEAKPYADLEKEAREFRKELVDLEKEIRIPPDTKGIPADDTPLGRVRRVQWFLGSSWEAPSSEVLEYLRRAEVATRTAVESTNAFFAEKLPEFRRKVLQESELSILADSPALSDD